MDYKPQSDFEKLQELYSSGFITEYEFNKRRKELGDDSNSINNDSNTNQYSYYNSYNNNNNNDYNTTSTYDYNQVIPVTYDDNNNNSNSTYNNNNNDYNSTAYDYNSVIPVTYDNDSTNYNYNNNNEINYNSNNYNNNNTYNSTTYDYNQVTPVTYDNDSIYKNSTDQFNQYNTYTDNNDYNNSNSKNIYNSSNNNSSNHDSNNNSNNNSKNQINDEYDDTYVIKIKDPIVKKSFVVESRNVNKEKANRKIEYPLIVHESNTIHKDIGNNFVLYSKDRQGNHQSDLITLEGKSETDVWECMKQFIGIKDDVHCHFIVYKLIVDPKRPEPKEYASNYKLSNYRVQVFQGDKELVNPNHYLIEYASYPIFRSNWNPSAHYRYPHYFSQYIDKFSGFPTQSESYDYSLYKNFTPIKAGTSQQFKTKYNKINFILSYRYLQNLSGTYSIYSVLKKESIINITDKIKNAINSGTCVICNEMVYGSQCFLCSNHHNNKLISAYESFIYLNNNEALDDTIDTVAEVLSNQQIKYEEPIRDIVINKEKFKLLEPEQLVELSKKPLGGLASHLSDKFKNLHNENYDENQIENNFKIDYSRQTSYSDNYYDYY